MLIKEYANKPPAHVANFNGALSVDAEAPSDHDRVSLIMYIGLYLTGIMTGIMLAALYVSIGA